MAHCTHKTGRAGEYLACSFISLIAESVMIPSEGCTSDIVFEYQDTFYRVQVKTKSKMEKHRINWRFDLRRGKLVKDRNYSQDSVEIFALVCLEYMNVVFVKKPDKSQVTIVDEHMKNNNAVKNLLDILEK